MQHGIKKTFEVSGEKQVVDNVVQAPPPEGFRFGRMFGNLFPFKPTDASLDALGKTMAVRTNNDNSNIPAGYTYFGQFVDHDITRDGTADLPTDIKDTLTLDQMKQLRSPSLDLDSLYGAPEDAESLKAANGLHLRLGTTSGIPIGSGAPTGPGQTQIFQTMTSSVTRPQEGP